MNTDDSEMPTTLRPGALCKAYDPCKANPSDEIYFFIGFGPAGRLVFLSKDGMRTKATYELPLIYPV